MFAAVPDRFTNFCCEGTMGILVVMGAVFLLLRAFRRNDDQGGGPPDNEPL
jgi:hypothetical protein